MEQLQNEEVSGCSSSVFSNLAVVYFLFPPEVFFNFQGARGEENLAKLSGQLGDELLENDSKTLNEGSTFLAGSAVYA